MTKKTNAPGLLSGGAETNAASVQSHYSETDISASTRPAPDAPLVEWALFYAATGAHVFPCHAGAKTPATPHGFRDATTDPDTIRAWWDERPHANIGMWPGPARGTVIDVDVKNDSRGLESLSRLAAAVPDDAFDTATVRTPSGGLHYHYIRPDGAEPMGQPTYHHHPGIETRDSVGYVLLPPSRVSYPASAGLPPGQYEWLNGGLETAAPFPPEVRAALQSGRVKRHVDVQAVPPGRPGAPDENAVARAVGAALARSGGGRNNAAMWLACQLRDIRLTREQAEAEARNYYERLPDRGGFGWNEIAHALDQAFTRNPRDYPALFNGDQPPRAPLEDEAAAERPPDADPALWAAGVYATRMDNVRPEPITWIWTNYIPAGAITVIEGDGGRGKSLFTLDIAARVTNGDTMPDGTISGINGPHNVILVGLEDGKSTTVRPRLDAAGADPARVYVWEGSLDGYGVPRPASLAPEDLPRLENLIVTTGARLVVVDAFTAVLPERIDSHKDQAIRLVLMPLKQLAERTGAAVLLIRHWTKGAAARASDRGVGSVGIGNVARSRLAVGDDPTNPEARAVGQTKLNLVPPDTPTYGFTVAVADNGHPRIQWTGRASCSANDIVMNGDQDPETRTAKQDAEAFLWEYLNDGPKPAREVEQAARLAGIERKPLRAAREAIERAATTDPAKPFKMPRREGFGSGSVVMWELPDPIHRCPHTPIDALSGRGHLCGSEGIYGDAPPNGNGRERGEI